MGVIHLQFEMVYTTPYDPHLPWWRNGQVTLPWEKFPILHRHCLINDPMLDRSWSGQEWLPKCTLHYLGSTAESVKAQCPIKPITMHSVPASWHSARNHGRHTSRRLMPAQWVSKQHISPQSLSRKSSHYVLHMYVYIYIYIHLFIHIYIYM